MKSRKYHNGAGGGLLGLGMAFLVIAMSGRPALLGVGMALLALGLGFLANAGRRCP